MFVVVLIYLFSYNSSGWEEKEHFGEISPKSFIRRIIMLAGLPLNHKALFIIPLHFLVQTLSLSVGLQCI